MHNDEIQSAPRTLAVPANRALIAACVGICSLFILVTRVNELGPILLGQVSVGPLYLVRGVGILASIPLLWHFDRMGNKRTPEMVDGGAGLLMAVVALILLLHVTGAIVLEATLLPLAVAGYAILLGWLYLRWAVALSTQSYKNALAIVCLACILWQVLGRIIVDFFPDATSTLVLLLVLPLLAVSALRFSDPASDAGESLADSSSALDIISVLKVLTSIAMAGIALSFLVRTTTVDPLTGMTLPQVIPTFIPTLTTIVIFAVALVGAFTSERLPDFTTLWRTIVLFLAIALVASNAGIDVVARLLAQLSWNLLTPIAWLTACMLTSHPTTNRYVIVGLGLCAFSFSMGAGSVFAGTVLSAMGQTTACSLLLLGFIVVSLACLDVRDPGTQQLFQQPEKAPLTSVDADSLAERCAELGRTYHLTPRETEIMALVCQGRTRDYIAETLFISRNTVKTHVASLYAKTDAHNRTELQHLLDG